MLLLLRCHGSCHELNHSLADVAVFPVRGNMGSPHDEHNGAVMTTAKYEMHVVVHGSRVGLRFAVK